MMQAWTTLIFVVLPAAILAVPPLQIEDDRVKELPNEVPSSGRIQVPRYRLPVTVAPVFYKVMIRPVLKESTDFTQYTAPGSVTITVTCIADTNTITLHQKNLNIPLDQVKVRDLNGNNVPVVATLGDETKDFLVLTFENNLVLLSQYFIDIPFTAMIYRDKLDGMYLSTYTDPETNELRVLATTQFQPTNAREMFPCFDEPDMKAQFDISVARLKDGFHSLSNSELAGPPQDDPEHDGWVWDHYQRTPKMSTYLIAVIVSDFVSEDAPTGVFNKPVKVWGPGYIMKQNGGVWAANASANIIKYFQDFTEIEYAMPKLDSVAIPQFSAGAMENWGLNTYRVEYLLHIPNENTEAERKKITQVLGHEIAHQWYGNHVTCKWWTHTWLNEGFARFLQYRGMTAAAPELKTDIAIVSDATQLGMIYDAGPNTHPVLNSALSPEEVDYIFDRITYDKGASLLRMMESVLTTKVFDDSLRHYLNKTQFNTAVQDDLFTSFQEVGGAYLGGFTAKKILDTWTTQPGFPIVRVSSAGKNKIYLSQEKFSYNTGARVAPLDDAGTWIIPVSIVTADKADFTVRTPVAWIPKDVTTLSVTADDIDTTKWIIVNPDLGGYYRVLYDGPLAKLIQAQLESDPSAISPGTRSQILEDYFQFAEAKYVNIESALEFTKYLNKESELVVWAPLLTNIRKIYNKFTRDAAAFQFLKNYLGPKVAGALDLIKWKPEKGEVGAAVILRAQLLDFACSFGATECVEYSKELFADWVAQPGDRTIIPSDIRPVVFCAAVANGNGETWTQAYDRYMAETFAAAKSQLLKALACPSTEDGLNDYISSALAGNPGLNLITALRDIAGNSAGRKLVYDFMVSEAGKAAVSAENFASIISTLADNNKDESFIAQIRDYIANNDEALTDEVKASLNSSIAKVQNNINWWNMEGIHIQRWMEAHQ